MRWLGWIVAAALAWCFWRRYQAHAAAAAASAGVMRPRYRRTGPVPQPVPPTMGKLIPFGPNSVSGGDCGCGGK